jgi:hypothetical protein
MNTMSLNHNFLCINSELLYMESATQLSLLLYALINNFHSYVTIHNEGVYISFPSCALKLSNLELNSIYFTLTTINAFYLLRTRANCSRSVYIIQVRFFLMTSFKIAHQLQGNFKICTGTCPAAFCFHAGSLEMLLHHQDVLPKF